MTYKQLSRKDYQRLIGIAIGKKKNLKIQGKKGSEEKRWSKRWYHCSKSVAGQNDKQ